MKRWFVLLMGCLSTLFCAEEIRVVAVKPTPESNEVRTRVIFPRPYENKRKSPINVQLRLEGFPLGAATQNKRGKELYNDPEGQAIHVIIDNEPYLIYNQPFEEAYDKIISFHIPFVLKPGMHVIRAFPVYSYGESVKGKRAFAAEVFYFQDGKKVDELNIHLQKPYLTYNEPQGRYPAGGKDPILLDFLLSHCELSPNGFKVRLSIDGKMIQYLTEYSPYYLYGIAPGRHTVKLELIDRENQLVPGFFNVTEREIIVDNNQSLSP